MKKAKAWGLLLGVWSVGLLAAAGAYALHRPPIATPPAPRLVAEEAHPRPPERAMPSENTWVTITPITIVGTPPARIAPKKHAPDKPHCSSWTGLSQGPATSQVRVCE